MPFLFALIGLFAPRLVIALLWFFSGWFQNVFDTRLWPILGFIFLPLTLLWYSAVTNWFSGEWNWWQIALLIVAVITDLSSGKEATR